MDKLLSFTPEPFPELDREAEDHELDPLAGEWESEEAEEEVRGRRRPRLARKAPRRSVSKPTVRPRIQGRATGPRVKPLLQLPKLIARPFPVPALRTLPIPFIPPQWGLRPDLEPTAPQDVRRPEESRRPEQAGSEGSGSPPTAQPSEEPPSEHVRWVQDCLNRALGLQLPVDGVMGRETRSAVRLLQERRGLPVTGMIGPDTEAALQAACSSVTESRNVSEQQLETEWAHPTSCTCPLCTEAATMKYQLSFEAKPFAGNTELQEFETLELETLDPWQGKSGADSPQKVRWIQESLNKILGLQLKVDGIKGLQTRSAIRNFQQRHGIPVDGIVDPKTEAAITKASGSMPNLTVPPSDMPAYTQCDFTDPNIDVSAQYALYGMLKSDPASRDASVQMLAAVKTGRLGGIYKEDQRVPGMRGVHLGHGWYGPLISTYRRSASSAACIPPALHPSHKLPIISFKKALAKNISVLGEQLRQVYLDCQLPYLPPVPASGRPCTRPAPPPPPPPRRRQATY